MDGRPWQATTYQIVYHSPGHVLVDHRSPPVTPVRQRDPHDSRIIPWNGSPIISAIYARLYLFDITASPTPRSGSSSGFPPNPYSPVLSPNNFSDVIQTPFSSLMILSTKCDLPPGYEESCSSAPSSPISTRSSVTFSGSTRSTVTFASTTSKSSSTSKHSSLSHKSARHSRSYYIPSPRLLIPTTTLPSYDKLPSLEPWLDLFPTVSPTTPATPSTPSSPSPSKSFSDPYPRPDIPTSAKATTATYTNNESPLAKLATCNLSLFLPSHRDDWSSTLLSLTSTLTSLGLVRDPHASIQVLLWPHTAETTQRIARDTSWLPEELRNTGLWMTQDRGNTDFARELGLDISDVLRNTLFAHVQHRTSRRGPGSSPLSPPPIITQDLMRQQACTPKELLGLIYHAGLSQVEFEHFVHVFYLLQCRRVFVAAAQAQIAVVEDAARQKAKREGTREQRRVEKVLSRWVVGVKRRWSAGEVNRRD